MRVMQIWSIIMSLWNFSSIFHTSYVEVYGRYTTFQVRTTELANNLGIQNVEPAMFGHILTQGSIEAVLFVPTVEEIEGCIPLGEVTSSSNKPIVFLLQRGRCTFVTKVINAQNAGAAAVVVFNNVDSSVLPRMSDDGNGTAVKIPSFSLRKGAGEVILASNVSLNAGNDVTVKIDWSFASKSKEVEYQMWTGSYDVVGSKFVGEFAPIADLLDRSPEVKASFTPLYHFADGKKLNCSGTKACGDRCIMDGLYCLPDGDHESIPSVSGAIFIQENIRQICIHKVDKQKWWKYVPQFEKTCINGEQKNAFTIECSEKVMKGVGIDPSNIRDCVQAARADPTKNTIIEDHLRKASEISELVIPSIFANNAVYPGSIDCLVPFDSTTCGPLSLVCASFDSPPSICQSNLGCPSAQKRSNGADNKGAFECRCETDQFWDDNAARCEKCPVATYSYGNTTKCIENSSSIFNVLSAKTVNDNFVVVVVASVIIGLVFFIALAFVIIRVFQKPNYGELVELGVIETNIA